MLMLDKITNRLLFPSQPHPRYHRVNTSSTLKQKCHHFDEIFVTGCTESCQNDNFQCSQWRKFHQNDNSSISVKTYPNGNPTQKHRHYCVKTTPWRRFDVIMTLFLRHMSAGLVQHLTRKWTHPCQSKMAVILKTAFSISFLIKKMFVCWI